MSLIALPICTRKVGEGGRQGKVRALAEPDRFVLRAAAPWRFPRWRTPVKRLAATAGGPVVIFDRRRPGAAAASSNRSGESGRACEGAPARSRTPGSRAPSFSLRGGKATAPERSTRKRQRKLPVRRKRCRGRRFPEGARRRPREAGRNAADRGRKSFAGQLPVRKSGLKELLTVSKGQAATPEPRPPAFCLPPRRPATRTLPRRLPFSPDSPRRRMRSLSCALRLGCRRTALAATSVQRERSRKRSWGQPRHGALGRALRRFPQASAAPEPGNPVVGFRGLRSSRTIAPMPEATVHEDRLAADGKRRAVRRGSTSAAPAPPVSGSRRRASYV